MNRRVKDTRKLKGPFDALIVILASPDAADKDAPIWLWGPFLWAVLSEVDTDDWAPKSREERV